MMMYSGYILLGIFAGLILADIEKACVDHMNSCIPWAISGFCSYAKYKEWMAVNCKKSCKYCKEKINCGKPDVQQGRVIWGKNAKHGSWPWQILMVKNGSYNCGGSLISPNWVVTAAHCVSPDGSPALYKVRIGEHDTSVSSKTKGDKAMDIPVEKIIKHAKFNAKTFDYDIALMKLAIPAKFGKYVKPVCLPKQGEKVPVGTECYITGWGATNHIQRMHHLLQQGKMEVKSQAECQKKNTGMEVTERMICGGARSLGHGWGFLSGCHGDSGGPFVCKTGSGGRWVLHGVVSWGSPRCDAMLRHTVFARVSQLRNWLDWQMATY